MSDPVSSPFVHGDSAEQDVMQVKRLVFHHAHPIVKRAVSTFIARGVYDVVEASSPAELTRLLAENEVSVVLADLALPSLHWNELRRLVSLPENQNLHTVLIGTGEGASSMSQRVVELPRAIVVSAGRTFGPRIVETLAVAAGAHPRQHVPDVSQPMVTLHTIVASAAARLMNLSESGMKVRCVRGFEVGTLGDVVMDAPVPLRAPTEVVRRFWNGKLQEWELGLRFRATPSTLTALQETLGHTVQADPPLAPPMPEGRVRAPRFSVPPLLRIKAKLTAADRSAWRAYVRVVDLSESGVLMLSSFSAGLSVSDRISIKLLWDGDSLDLQARLVRTMGVPLEEPVEWLYGAKFTTIPRGNRRKLLRLLAVVKARGMATHSHRGVKASAR